MRKFIFIELISGNCVPSILVVCHSETPTIAAYFRGRFSVSSICCYMISSLPDVLIHI